MNMEAPIQTTFSPLQGNIKVRCPQCLKLFRVDMKSLSAGKTKFQCNQCQEKFTLFSQDCEGLEEVIGFAESWEETELDKGFDSNELSQRINQEEVNISEAKPTAPSNEFTLCPKCGVQNDLQALECISCRVVIKKFKELQLDPSFAQAPQKLKELWTMVLSHYEDEDLHQEFIRQCRKANQLEFAASRYKKILLSQPNEELAIKLRNEIVLLTGLQSEVIKEQAFQEPKKFVTHKVPFTSLAMLLSAIVMFVGYMVPEFRNLMGIGAAVLFVTTAIKLLFK